MSDPQKRRSPRQAGSAQSRDNGPANDKPFLVLCTRRDGREREWMRDATEVVANAIAARLVAVGCAARVQGVDGAARP